MILILIINYTFFPPIRQLRLKITSRASGPPALCRLPPTK